MTPERSKPLLAAAFTCERVLHEDSGVISAIRLVDTVTIPAPPSPEIVPLVRLWAVIYFKSGEATGRHFLSLVMRPPDGGPEKQLGDPAPMDFMGGAHGVTLAIELSLAVKRFGLYWVDVVLDGERITSMPINLLQTPAASPPPALPTTS